MSDTSREIKTLSTEEQRKHLAQMLREKARKAVSVYPSSSSQFRGWYYRVRTGSPSYTVVFIMRIRSQIDVAALQRAYQKLVERHPALRTTFSFQEGKLLQEVHGYQDVCFEQRDCSKLSLEELRTEVFDAYQRPLNLEKGPVFRITLFTLAPDYHILLQEVDHIVSDGWSNWIILDELPKLYQAELEGTPATLPQLQWHHSDYARWQEELLASHAGERHWEYWKNEISGADFILNLPLDFPRPPLQSYRIAVHSFRLASSLTQQLRDLAQAEGGTLYMVLVSALLTFLHRYTGQEDILLGSLTTGRSRPEFENIVGDFTNVVALRGDFSQNPTFREFLANMRLRILGAFEHQDYPFPQIVEHLQLQRDPSRSPVVQVVLTYHQAQRQTGVLDLMGDENEIQHPFQWGHLEMDHFTSTTHGQEEDQDDFSIEIVEVRKSLFVFFKYNPDLFTAETVERMGEHFRILVQGIVAAPQQRVSEIPLLTDRERHQVLVEWNDTSADYPLDTCIHHLIEAQVERTPNAIALVFENRHLTYRELNCKANQLAHYLCSLGVGPEIMVGLAVERSFEMLIGLLGILKAGGAYVPIDPTYPQERLTFMLEDSKVPVLLTQQRVVTRLPSIKAEVVCLDTGWATTIAQESEENPKTDVTAESLLYMIYTSGSTGKPKGAMNIHRALVNRLFWMQDAYHLTAEDRVLQKTPFSFDVSGWEFWWPLLTGAQLIIAKSEGHKDSAYLVQLIQEQQITTMHFVPPMLQVFLEQKGVGECTSLRQIVCSGEALPYSLQERLFEKLPETELHNLYGPTEAAIDVTYWQCLQGDSRRIVPIGKPISNTQIYILDKYLQPVPIGVPGELHIGGVNLARGYFDRPELTEEKFIPDPFSDIPGARLYKTGDSCRFLPDGNIEYVGRMDYQVKIRGFRIELGEIEAILAEHPTVREAVVLLREDLPGGKGLIAYVVPHQGVEPKSNDLHCFLAEKLPDYMVPSTFLILETFPLTPSGKVNRRALPEPEVGELGIQQEYVAPRTPAEQTIASVWAELLHRERVGIYDNFFELGGHSLLATQLISRIQEAFGVTLALSTLFEVSDVASLAELIVNKQLEGVEQEALERILSEAEAISDEDAAQLLFDEDNE